MNIIGWLVDKYFQWKRKKALKKKMKEIRKNDPFIYNH
jgi:hypothetical protein